MLTISPLPPAEPQIPPADNRLTSQPRGGIFQHFIGRLAGLPFESIDGLRAAKSAHTAHKILCGEAILATFRDQLVDQLFVAISQPELATVRGSLVALKRDIHNLRSPKPGLLAKVEGRLGADLSTDLERYRALHRRGRQLERELEGTFAIELAEIRQDFRAAILDPDFQRGLLLSSTTLTGQLQRYLRADGSPSGSKLRQIERSLMRYFSRMVTKTTPFGTFCGIVPGGLEAGKGAPRLVGDPAAKKSHPRLNKALYRALLKHLENRAEVRRWLPVRLNPTLRQEAGRWVFLGQVDDLEVFQRMNHHPALDLIHDLFEESQLRRLDEILGQLTADSRVAAAEQQAMAFVNHLLQVGFLRFSTGIAEQEVNWDLQLAALLASIDDPHATRTSQALGRLRGVVDDYPAANLEHRGRLLQTARSEIRALFTDLGADQPLDSNQPPFYEDAAGQAALTIPAESLDDAAAMLAEFVELTRKVAYPRAEQANARRFFERCYGKNAEPVDLLKFYEDYYRDHFKEHLERQRLAAQTSNDPYSDESYNPANPFGLELINKIHASIARANRLVAERWRRNPRTAEINLEAEDIKAAFDDVPDLLEPGRSVSVFAQYAGSAKRHGDDMLILDGYSTGHGKYLSRFLYFLPSCIEQDLMASNSRMEDHRLAEICADADFNANLHPPLLPWELSYPTGETSKFGRRLACTDLDLAPDPADPDALRLIHRESGEPVIPVDLGFLNPRMRPPLFQLLSALSPPSTFSMPLPDAPANREGATAEATDAEDGWIYRPRILYRNRLVLARRRWQLEGRLFPWRGKSETEAAYFLRLQRWRRQHGLPERVFFRIRVRPPVLASGEATPAAMDGKTARRPQIRQHLYKPQYLDFDNPLLVDLFSRSTENLEHFRLTFEEMLPAPEHHFGDDRGHHASELVLQVDFDASGPAEPAGAKRFENSPVCP